MLSMGVGVWELECGSEGLGGCQKGGEGGGVWGFGV